MAGVYFCGGQQPVQKILRVLLDLPILPFSAIPGSSEESQVHSCSPECDSRSMMSFLAELDRSNVVDIDLGNAEFKANAHHHMAEWARRRPFYVLGNGPPQVVVGRYADVHRVFSDTDTFKSEMPRGPGWEQFNKIMFAQFVTQMDGEQHARVRRLLMPGILVAADRATSGQYHPDR
jgi:hypothetical protein